jgi:lysophospholipase L1-like esterase
MLSGGARFAVRPSVVAALAAAGLLTAVAVAATVPAPRRTTARPPTAWTATWATAPQLTEVANLPPAPGFVDCTLRQVVHVSLGGKTLRVRLSNAFGRSALTLLSVHIARSAGGGTILAGSDRALRFGGAETVTIPEGAPAVSDPVDFDLPPLSDVAITLRLRDAPAEVTGHPGSRTTSYLQPGDAVSSPDLSAAVRVDHWYFLAGIDVVTTSSAGAVAILGDSITDGRGSTTNGNDRWPDILARRLQADKKTSEVAVLNLGVGGNRLLRDGLGPNVLARLDRDVLSQPGVRSLVILEGVNDIGTAASARIKGEPAATAGDVIFALGQIVARARAHGIRVYGATIMPFEGFRAYDTPEAEADRQAVNAWIRGSGHFDAVIDFDQVTRDPDRPARLSAAVDGGDHLHLSAAGYRRMAEAIDLALFAGSATRR